MSDCAKCMYNPDTGSKCTMYLNCHGCPMCDSHDKKHGCRCMQIIYAGKEKSCPYFEAEEENESHD